MSDGSSERFELSARVHQATGMIAGQLDCDVSEALARLRIRADASGQTLDETALDVIDRVFFFDS